MVTLGHVLVLVLAGAALSLLLLLPVRLRVGVVHVVGVVAEPNERLVRKGRGGG